MKHQFSRRNFLKQGARAGFGVTFEGMMGVGGIGRAYVKNFLKIDEVEILAVCDLPESRTAQTQKLCKEAGKHAAALSIVTELSAELIKNNRAPIKFPDFTRGKWKTERPLMVDIEI